MEVTLFVLAAGGVTAGLWWLLDRCGYRISIQIVHRSLDDDDDDDEDSWLSPVGPRMYDYN